MVRYSEATRAELLRMAYADFARTHQDLIRRGCLDWDLKCHSVCVVTLPQGAWSARAVTLKPGDWVTFMVNEDE